MNDVSAPSAPAAATVKAAKSPFWTTRRIFILLLSAYLFFNLFLGPLENWKNIAFGMRYGDSNLELLPFTQGSFFFFAFIINSDSIFRSLQHQLISRQLSPFLVGTVFANVGLLGMTWADFSGLEDRAAHIKGFTLPVSDQMFFALLAIIVGYIVTHAITAEELEPVHVDAGI